MARDQTGSSRICGPCSITWESKRQRWLASRWVAEPYSGLPAPIPIARARWSCRDSDGGIDDDEVLREQERLAGERRGSLAQILSNAYAPDFPQREPFKFFLYRQISALNLHVAPNLLQVRMRHPAEPIATRRIAAMLIVGEQDALVPPSAMQLIANRIPQARLVKVPGAGHSVYFERPEEFNRILGDFLRGVTR